MNFVKFVNISIEFPNFFWHFFKMQRSTVDQVNREPGVRRERVTCQASFSENITCHETFDLP